MTSWKCMTVPTCSLLWLALLMEPRSLSSCLVVATFYICYSPPITVDQTVASRYSTKVRVCFYCLHALQNVKLDELWMQDICATVHKYSWFFSQDLKTFNFSKSKYVVVNGTQKLYWSAFLVTLLTVCVKTKLCRVCVSGSHDKSTSTVLS